MKLAWPSTLLRAPPSTGPETRESDPRLALSTLPPAAPGASPPTLGKSSRRSEGLVWGQGRAGGGASAPAPAPPGPCRAPYQRPSWPPWGATHSVTARNTQLPARDQGQRQRPLQISHQLTDNGGLVTWHRQGAPSRTQASRQPPQRHSLRPLLVSRGPEKQSFHFPRSKQKDSSKAGEDNMKLTFQHPQTKSDWRPLD